MARRPERRARDGSGDAVDPVGGHLLHLVAGFLHLLARILPRLLRFLEDQAARVHRAVSHLPGAGLHALHRGSERLRELLPARTRLAARRGLLLLRDLALGGPLGALPLRGLPRFLRLLLLRSHESAPDGLIGPRAARARATTGFKYASALASPLAGNGARRV